MLEKKRKFDGQRRERVGCGVNSQKTSKISIGWNVP
jgi:hypothetical protein